MAELIQEDTLNQTENNSDIENLDQAINANFIKNPTCEDEPELIINDSNTMFFSLTILITLVPRLHHNIQHFLCR